MTPPPPGPRFRPALEGVTLHLPAAERKALATVVKQFRQLLFSGSDPNLTRLEPPACPEDPVTELEYREMAAMPLLQRRLEAADTLEAGLDEPVLDHEAVGAWMQTLNAVRLYLGERLGVGDSAAESPSEHPDDKRGDDSNAQLMSVYEWLGFLLDQLVSAAAESLPTVGDGDK